MVTTPKTAWMPPNPAEGEPVYVPKPAKPMHGKGATKYDKNFDHMLRNEVAIVLPTDDIASFKKAYQRYEQNKAIAGKYSFRQAINPKTKTHTVWLEKR